MKDNFCKTCGRSDDCLMTQTDYQLAICRLLGIEPQRYVTKKWIVNVYKGVKKMKEETRHEM